LPIGSHGQADASPTRIAALIRLIGCVATVTGPRTGLTLRPSPEIVMPLLVAMRPSLTRVASV